MYENVLGENSAKHVFFFFKSRDGMKDVLRLHNFKDEIITYNFNKGNNDKYFNKGKDQERSEIQLKLN